MVERPEPLYTGAMACSVCSADPTSIGTAFDAVEAVSLLCSTDGFEPFEWADAIAGICTYPTFIQFDMLWLPDDRLILDVVGGHGVKLEALSGVLSKGFTAHPMPSPGDPVTWSLLSRYQRVNWTVPFEVAVLALQGDQDKWSKHKRLPGMVYAQDRVHMPPPLVSDTSHAPLTIRSKRKGG